MKTILLDVDGVLANFVQGSIEAHGMQGEFRHDEAINYHYFKDSPWSMTSEEFFVPLDNFQFWDSLPLYPEANDLYSLLSVLPCDLFICTTAPSGSVHAASGKLSWLKRNFGVDSDSVVITRDKHLLAGEGVMLIDDMEGNTAKFHESGGAAITVPRPWNRYRSVLGNPEFSVEEVGKAAAKWVHGFGFFWE